MFMQLFMSIKLHFSAAPKRKRSLFSNRVIKMWNQLDQGAVDATSSNAFKSKLDRLRYTRMGFFMDQSAEP